MNEKNSQRGSVTVIVLGAMVAILGLGAIVIDGGMLYYEQAKLQTAVDSVVLAGARVLHEGPLAVSTAAENVAIANGLSLLDLQLSINTATGKVTASAVKQVELGLAKILNHSQAEVGALAEAQVGGISGLKGMAPLGVIWQEFLFGQLYDIKVGAGDGGGGNYGALALGGTGSANYRDNLRYGYPGWLRVGDIIMTEPGNMSNPTKLAIEGRIDACQHGCTFDRYVASCSKVLFVPVINSLPNGRGEVTIIGFAGFFVDDYTGQGNQNYIRGRFIQSFASGEAGASSSYGLTMIKLTR
ncbi:MAG: hypothetical protein FD169_1758 [Bacillota bacterium]|nr:MAG: hypothetical protein FD169_1758 [Bacillota bacterium]